MCRDPGLTCVFYLARKGSKFRLSFLLDYLPKSWRTAPLPSPFPSLSETSKLDADIFQNKHGSKWISRNVNWHICTRRAAVVSWCPEPRLSLAPPSPPMSVFCRLLPSLLGSPHPVSLISDPLLSSLWNALRIEEAYKNHPFIWKVFLDDLSPCWSLPSWSPLRLMA